MTQYTFGTGQLFTTPVGGGAPLRFGALQDVSVDFSSDTKMLHGQYQYALDTARGKTKIEWKAASGNIDVASYNTFYFGGTVTTGGELIQVFNETGTVPASVAYTITVANGATFFQDLGVYNAATGLPYQQVASAPATGQYSVNSTTGVYTFNLAQASTPVLLNYLYTSAATGGNLTISNNLMGDVPSFQLILSQKYKAKSITMILYANISDKLSLPFKQDDYLVGEISGSAYADAANRIGRLSTTSITGGGG